MTDPAKPKKSWLSWLWSKTKHIIVLYFVCSCLVHVAEYVYDVSKSDYNIYYTYTDDGAKSAVVLNIKSQNLRIDSVLEHLAIQHSDMHLIIDGISPAILCDDRIIGKFKTVEIRNNTGIIAPTYCDAFYNYECKVMAAGETAFVSVPRDWRGFFGVLPAMQYIYETPGDLYCVAWAAIKYCPESGCSVKELRTRSSIKGESMLKVPDAELVALLYHSGAYDPTKHHLVNTEKGTIYLIAPLQEE